MQFSGLSRLDARFMCAKSNTSFLQADTKMALLDQAPVGGQHTSLATRLQSRAARAFGALVDWNDTRRTRKALSQLSAHELDDIGLTRGDIDAILRQNRF